MHKIIQRQTHIGSPDHEVAILYGLGQNAALPRAPDVVQVILQKTNEISADKHFPMSDIPPAFCSLSLCVTL